MFSYQKNVRIEIQRFDSLPPILSQPILHNTFYIRKIQHRDYKRDIDILSKQTGIPAESVTKNLNYLDENAKFWTEDLKTWSDWYLENDLIQKPLDLEKITDTELYK